MKFRRLMFWVGVGAVGVLGNFFVELAADKIPVPGLKTFVAYLHRGPGVTS